MRMTCDPDADALMLRLSEAPVAESEEVAPNVVLDFNGAVLSASRCCSSPISPTPTRWSWRTAYCATVPRRPHSSKGAAGRLLDFGHLLSHGAAFVSAYRPIPQPNIGQSDLPMHRLRRPEPNLGAGRGQGGPWLTP
jgi:Protein of unknown function (DUF2283)